MLKITPTLFLPDSEFEESYIQSSGPGGQNINKVDTGVQLRFDIQLSSHLDPECKKRLVKLAGRKVTKLGVLIIEAKRYRTQAQNRQDAEDRLVRYIQRALDKPKTRTPSHPTRSSVEERMKSKKLRGEVKRLRSSTDE